MVWVQLGLGWLNCFFFFCKTHNPLPTLASGNLSRMSLALFGLHPICRNPPPPGGGAAEGGSRSPESEADRVSLVMLLSPWRWLERRGGGGGEDILGRVGADATS